MNSSDLSELLQISNGKESIKMKRQDIQQKVESVVLESYEEMYRLAYSYVRNEQDAMDIVQESVYKCIRHAGKIKQEAYIHTWVWRVVINTALDFKRMRAREQAWDSWEEVSLVQAEQEYDVIDALGILKERERTMLILYYFDGFQLEEIADMMEMNISTIKSTLYRSLKKLRVEMVEGGTVS